MITHTHTLYLYLYLYVASMEEQTCYVQDGVETLMRNNFGFTQFYNFEATIIATKSSIMKIEGWPHQGCNFDSVKCYAIGRFLNTNLVSFSGK